MTKQEAVRILIHHAAQNVCGSSRIVYTYGRERDRNEVSEAVKTLWKEAGMTEEITDERIKVLVGR